MLFCIFFGCGSVVIDNHEDNTMKYHVQDIKSIVEIILPFFDKYPLITSKWLAYPDFKKVALMIYNKEHLTREGLNIIITLKKRNK